MKTFIASAPVLLAVAVIDVPSINAEEGRSVQSAVRDCVEAERNLVRALRKPFKLRSGETSLGEFAKELGEATGIDVQLDFAELRILGTDSHEKINVASGQLTLLSHLNRSLPEERGFGWATRGKTLWITSSTAAERSLAARVYEVTDLVEKLPATPILGNPGFLQITPASGTEDVNGGPVPQLPESAEYDPQPLIDAIESGTNPDAWQMTGGGNGSISTLIIDDRVLLVIRQTEAMHLEVERLLFLIREALASATADDLGPPAASED